MPDHQRLTLDAGSEKNSQELLDEFQRDMPAGLEARRASPADRGPDHQADQSALIVMGTAAAFTGLAQTLSRFIMRRPEVEIAIKNDRGVSLRFESRHASAEELQTLISSLMSDGNDKQSIDPVDPWPRRRKS